jgi:transcriptional regulator with XRE-family HTH domain
LLRRGGIERPSPERIRALADFFKVDISYFLGEDPTFEDRHPEMDEALRRALADPQVREFALRINEFSTAERTFVLNMLNQARQLIKSMQVGEPVRMPATGTPSETDSEMADETGGDAEREP